MCSLFKILCIPTERHDDSYNGLATATRVGRAAAEGELNELLVGFTNVVIQKGRSNLNIFDPFLCAYNSMYGNMFTIPVKTCYTLVKNTRCNCSEFKYTTFPTCFTNHQHFTIFGLCIKLKHITFSVKCNRFISMLNKYDPAVYNYVILSVYTLIQPSRYM